MCVREIERENWNCATTVWPVAIKIILDSWFVIHLNRRTHAHIFCQIGFWKSLLTKSRCAMKIRLKFECEITPVNWHWWTDSGSWITEWDIFALLTLALAPCHTSLNDFQVNLEPNTHNNLHTCITAYSIYKHMYTI